MEISDVRIRLVKESTDRLKAVCSVTLDEQFVVRDVKVVEGTNGLFVAMPSRKLSTPCNRCRTQNNVRAKHCNECGQKLPPARIPADADGREKAHRDIAHPISTEFRQKIQDAVLESYRQECEESAEVCEPVEHKDEAECQVEDKREAECQVEDKREAECQVEDKREPECQVEDKREPEREEKPAFGAVDEEPEDADEPNGNVAEASTGGTSEYNSLIAGLDSGGRSQNRGRRDRGSSDSRRNDSRDDRNKSRGPKRDIWVRPAEKSEDKPAEKPVEKPREPQRTETVVAAKVAPPTPAPAINEPEEMAFGGGLLGEPTKPKAKRPPAKKREEPVVEAPKPEPAPATDDIDDGGAFGAGLL